MSFTLSRRRLLAGAGTTLLAACAAPEPQVIQRKKPMPGSPKPQNHTPPVKANNGSAADMRLFASSGFAEDSSRVAAGLNRLSSAGFNISNQAAAYRRYQRFAGTDAERIADLQDVAAGRVPTPKVLMGVRGGYGAARLLTHIDWASLGARMRENQTLLFGFSDVTAIQAALLAQGNMPSFAGPMLYSEFGKATPDRYTMDSFIRTASNAQSSVFVSEFQSRDINAEGTLWGGNLSVLAALSGSPYMPKIQNGILFLEDVAEQPYRIERMLYTLHLAGILKTQQAVILGDFRMGNIRDSYDSGYTLAAVVNAVSRAAGVPILTGFPFGHITQKTTFPLGAHAKLQSSGNGGYSVTFSGYPTLNANALNLNSLLPADNFVENFISENSVIEE